MEPVTKCLSTVKREPVKWLWPGRIPRGKVTLLCGDPGLGKSFVTMDMAARVTACQDWPDAETPLRQPGSVLVLSAEDDPADTIRPRLEAAGGDPANLVVMDGVRRGPLGAPVTGVSLTVDVEAIETAIARMERPRLVIIDPISAYMGDADSHNNAEVRGILAQLSAVAGRLGTAIVCVTHLNKAPGGKAVYRAMGSLAFTAAARMVWQVAKLPGDETQRAMVLVKSNLPNVAEGLSFKIAQDEQGGGFVQWLETRLPINADFVEQESGDASPDTLSEASEFLKSFLSAGPRLAADVMRAAGEAGISATTLKRAKKIAGIIATHEGAGRERPWIWKLGAA